MGEHSKQYLIPFVGLYLSYTLKMCHLSLRACVQPSMQATKRDRRKHRIIYSQHNSASEANSHQPAIIHTQELLLAIV